MLLQRKRLIARMHLSHVFVLVVLVNSAFLNDVRTHIYTRLSCCDVQCELAQYTLSANEDLGTQMWSIQLLGRY